MSRRSIPWTRWAPTLMIVVAALMAGGTARARADPRPGTSPTPSTAAHTPATQNPSPHPCPSAQIFPDEPVPHCVGPSATPTPVVNKPKTPGRGCEFWELSCQVDEAIDAWFTGLAMMAIPPVMDLFGKTLLTTPEIDAPAMTRVHSLWFASEAIADTCFVVLVVIGGLLLMSGHAFAPGTAAKDIVARLLLAFVAANCSMLVLEQAIKLANGLAHAFVEYGAANADPRGAASLMKTWLVGNVATLGMLSGLVTLVAVVLALIVAGGYIMRIVVTMLLVIAAPLALVCHALPQTDGLARLWWRAISGMLAIQVAQSLLFATAVIVLSAKDGDTVPLVGIPGKKGIVDLLLVVCLLYIMARVPSWVSRTIWGGTLGRSPIGNATRFLFSILVLRRITGAIAGRGGRPVFPPRGPMPPRIPPRPPGPPRPWVQPELPFQWPSPRGQQLELPNMPPPRPTPDRGIQLQLPLRPPAQPPNHWRQGELPIGVRAEQLRLPLRLPRQTVQQPLFNDFDRGRRPRPRIEDFPPREQAPDQRPHRPHQPRDEHR